MSKPNMKLVGDAPPRSPEREQLAEAIARRDTATKQLVRIAAAHERASETVYDLKDSVDKAIATLDEAKAGEGSYLAAVALGEADATLSPVKAAAAAVEEANDQLGTARRTRDALEAEMKAVESELMWAKSKLDDAVRDVVRADPAIRKLAADFSSANRHYNDLHRAMETVQNFLPDDLKYWHGTGRWPDLAAAATWSAAITALASDADARLPTN
jgi:chromosome segregation ATPase